MRSDIGKLLESFYVRAGVDVRLTFRGGSGTILGVRHGVPLHRVWLASKSMTTTWGPFLLSVVCSVAGVLFFFFGISFLVHQALISSILSPATVKAYHLAVAAQDVG